MEAALAPGWYRVEPMTPRRDAVPSGQAGPALPVVGAGAGVGLASGLSPDLGEGLGRHLSFQELLESESRPGDDLPEIADVERGTPARAASPSRSASWRAALAAAAWAAARELGAQSAGVLAGLALRGGLASAGAAANAAVGTVAAGALGLAAYRAATLASAAAYPERGQAPVAVRVALGAAPLLLAAAGVGYAASTGALAATGAYLGSKLVQRCVRDFGSNALAGVLPSSEIVNAQGGAVAKDDLAGEDWGRALCNALPTAVLYAAQDFLAPSPDVLPGVAGLPSSLPYVAATGLVEAGRALSGTLMTAQLAHRGGRRLQARPAGGWKQLKKNLRSLDTLRQAGDAAAMRQSISVLGDVVGVVAPTTVRPAIWTLLRAEVKALGELRAPLVTRGQLALKRQQAALQPHAPRPAPTMLGEETGIAYPDEAASVTLHLPPDHPGATRLRGGTPPA